MKSVVAIILIFHMLFAAAWPKKDIHAFSKLSFLITHSWEHLTEDGFSVWQLVVHYMEEWDSDGHQPLEQVPINCPSCNYFTTFPPLIKYAVDLNFSEAPDVKFIPYQFSLTSGYNGSIFHPPKH